MRAKADRPDIEAGARVKARRLRVRREDEPEREYRDTELEWHTEARVDVRPLDRRVRTTEERSDS